MEEKNDAAGNEWAAYIQYIIHIVLCNEIRCKICVYVAWLGSLNHVFATVNLFVNAAWINRFQLELVKARARTYPRTHIQMCVLFFNRFFFFFNISSWYFLLLCYFDIFSYGWYVKIATRHLCFICIIFYSERI